MGHLFATKFYPYFSENPANVTGNGIFPVQKTLQNVMKTCGQGARKSAAKTALSRAPLALTVSIDLSASGGEQGRTRVASPSG